MPFYIHDSFHGKPVTVFLANGVKLEGTLNLDGDDVWLMRDGVSQQINPENVATVMPGIADSETVTYPEHRSCGLTVTYPRRRSRERGGL